MEFNEDALHLVEHHSISATVVNVEAPAIRSYQGLASGCGDERFHKILIL